MRLAATGTPSCAYSQTFVGKARSVKQSRRSVERPQAASAIRPGIALSGATPRNATDEPRPSSATRRCSSGSSGPSPQMSRWAPGRASWIVGIASTAWETP